MVLQEDQTRLAASPIPPAPGYVPARTELAYRLWWSMCRRAAGSPAALTESRSPLMTTGSVHIPGLLSRALADDLSARVTEVVERGEHLSINDKVRHLSITVERPLETIGAELLDGFRDERLDGAIREFYGSHYRLQWVGVNRSLPAPEGAPAVSWLWHADGLPSGVTQVIVFLTDAGTERGSTELMDVPSSRAFNDAGYAGVEVKDRRGDLDVLAREANLTYAPYRHEVEAGGAVFFNQNCLHRAVSPASEHRDAAFFILLPSRIPWDAHLAKRGVDRLTKNTRSWPRLPWG